MHLCRDTLVSLSREIKKEESEFVRHQLMLDGGGEERPSSGRRGYYLFDGGGGGGGGCIGDWWLGIGGMLALGGGCCLGWRGEGESDSCGC